MKNTLVLIFLSTIVTPFLYAQDTTAKTEQEQLIQSLINKYTEAREKRDTVLLESILTDDIDQLVSSGVWRIGKDTAKQGMMQSSQSNPGSRTITVDKVRFLTSECGIADARYEIQNTDGTARRMWSTFVVVYDKDRWRIAAIRNMLPAVPE
ncbi:MAG: SgcJ/EcaC family oxidoreductase [Bacteroidetes bacterium]|nr:SgcJ/EcaC family oxidoreductase [Bacteroidota bacterium]